MKNIKIFNLKIKMKKIDWKNEIKKIKYTTIDKKRIRWDDGKKNFLGLIVKLIKFEVKIKKYI